jgi:hypothetical protein
MLVLPTPALLLVTGDGWGRSRCTFAASLPARRSFVSYNSRCVGSNGSWIALSVVPYLERRTVIVLLNPVTTVEVVLPSLIYDVVWVVSKVVSCPAPARTISPPPPSASVTGSPTSPPGLGGGPCWAPFVSLTRTTSPTLSTMAMSTSTTSLDVHVLRLPERRRRQSAGIFNYLPLLQMVLLHMGFLHWLLRFCHHLFSSARQLGLSLTWQATSPV